MTVFLLFAAYLSILRGVNAQNEDSPSLTTAIIASVFATVGFFILLLLIYLLLTKCCKKTERVPREAAVAGYDNPIVIADPEKEANNQTNEKNNEQPKQNNSSPTRNGSSFIRPVDGSVVTIFLDQKREATNGFDVAQNDSGDVAVSSVRRHGPAEGKLQEGDIIESITVFFDGITYEDALGLLSKSAPYPLAVSVSQKAKKNAEDDKEKPVEITKIFPQLSSPPLESEQNQQSSPTTTSVSVLKKEDETQINSVSQDGENFDSNKKSSALVYENDDNDTSSFSSSSNEGTFDVAPPQSETRVSGGYETPKVIAREDVTFKSGWRKEVRLLDLIEARLITEETVLKIEYGYLKIYEVEEDLKQYLKGNEPIAGVLIMDDKSKLSLYDATKRKMLRRGTAVGLLEAQAATGSIINPYNGEKMSVDEASKVGLLDRQLATILSRAEKAVLGFKTMLADKPLSLFEAMKRKLVMESHGIRLLEAQIATGGIIDPNVNHRLPEEVAFERGLFDERLHKVLETPDDDTKGFFDPNTDENLTYLELIERCTLDPETGFLLLPIFEGKQKKGYWKSN